MHRRSFAMRHDDDQHRKKPQPVRSRRKGENALEAQEQGPFAVGPHGPKDDHRDHHRHVLRC